MLLMDVEIIYLICACICGNINVINYLILLNCYINYVNDDGNNAIFATIHSTHNTSNKTAILRLLLDNGADYSIKK